jgi:hypothetical protein
MATEVCGLIQNEGDRPEVHRTSRTASVLKERVTNPEARITSL